MPVKKNGQLVPPIHESHQLIIGGRRIRVLLDSGKPMNPSKPIQPKDVPMQDLKAAQRKIEADEGQLEDSEASGSSEASDLRNNYSSAYMNGVTTNTVHNEDTTGDNKDEIIASPIQERSGRDIKFGDLPHPRKHERSDSEGLPKEGRKLIVVLCNESPIDDTEGELGKRTNTIEHPSSRRNSLQPRLRKATSTGIVRVATFEKVLHNAFG